MTVKRKPADRVYLFLVLPVPQASSPAKPAAVTWRRGRGRLRSDALEVAHFDPVVTCAARSTRYPLMAAKTEPPSTPNRMDAA